jgi:diacylglycerol kinase family enzyme
VKRILIVNPFASGVDEHRLAAVRAALPSGTETVLTTTAGEATEIVRSAGAVDAIYVFGGDGTFNEVLNGLEKDVPVGFLPGGGTSVLPRALGLPRNPGKAAQRVSEGRTRRIGLGRVNGRRFGFNAGLGFDAELVRKVDEIGRRPDGRRPGDVAFLKVASGALWSRHGRFEERLEIEGSGRAAFVLVANCTPYTYAGTVPLDLVPGASFDDGLAYVAPVTLRARDVPRLLIRGARGSGLKDGKALAARDVDRIVVRCDEPLPLQVDGEDTGDVVEVVYEAERDAVSVFV